MGTKKGIQRRTRQTLMRRLRRAKESRGYKVWKTSPITVKIGDLVQTHSGKTYILKDDGRRVLEHKDENGRVRFEVVKA
jgi:hypothetical protein